MISLNNRIENKTDRKLSSRKSPDSFHILILSHVGNENSCMTPFRLKHFAKPKNIFIKISGILGRRFGWQVRSFVQTKRDKFKHCQSQVILILQIAMLKRSCGFYSPLLSSYNLLVGQAPQIVVKPKSNLSSSNYVILRAYNPL